MVLEKAPFVRYNDDRIKEFVKEFMEEFDKDKLWTYNAVSDLLFSIVKAISSRKSERKKDCSYRPSKY